MRRVTGAVEPARLPRLRQLLHCVVVRHQLVSVLLTSDLALQVQVQRGCSRANVSCY
jgi:hypothetical protein